MKARGFCHKEAVSYQRLAIRYVLVGCASLIYLIIASPPPDPFVLKRLRTTLRRWMLRLSAEGLQNDKWIIVEWIPAYAGMVLWRGTSV